MTVNRKSKNGPVGSDESKTADKKNMRPAFRTKPAAKAPAKAPARKSKKSGPGEREIDSIYRKEKHAEPGDPLEKRQIVMPLIPLKGLHIYPGVSLSFDVLRDGSKMALKRSERDGELLFVSSQIEGKITWPIAEEIHDVGCVVKIRQIIELPNGGGFKVLAEGHSRGRILRYIEKAPFYIVEIEEMDSVSPYIDSYIQAYRRTLLSTLENYGTMSSKVPPEMISVLRSVESLSLLSDMIASNMNFPHREKQDLLETFDVVERTKKLIDLIGKETEISFIEKTIMEKVRTTIDKGQKDYFLREQIRVIQEELGDKIGIQEETDKYNEQMGRLVLRDEIREKLSKEIARLANQPLGSPEGSQIRSYLDVVFELPWGKQSKDRLSILQARKTLDKDHYGLEKVKERILEFLAVRKLKIESGINDSKGPILCLVGPPGVGKTSIAKSLAEALGRKYIRMSLGGVRDEAEIRGHRRTYIGSMPGRFIQAMKQAGTDNPLILLDEIDKLGNDYRGDPSAALLEVLDPEQNNTFRDHYLEIPYDLSKVLFITTANTWETIPQALLDRMEIVMLSGYTQEEKLEIAVRHIVPKQVKENALKKTNIAFSREAILEMIEFYTREAGVRGLERQIAKACRKVAMMMGEKDVKRVSITPENLEQILGKKVYRHDQAFTTDQVGVATGLAWTPSGGDTLAIEVDVMDGSGKIELTGQLGDVMQESARIAISYVRSHAGALAIDKDLIQKSDIHIHVPAGATPKDGPSAGITLTTALVSVFTGKGIKHNVAMTGEMTLRGRVLPIGGLKEKLIAAVRAGIDTAIVPLENKKDLEDLPESVLSKLTIHFVSTIEEVLKEAIR
jgi:ATP-dependent Lon protease